MYSVNLGGLFVLEPFITPALYQQYPGAVDEWTLSTLMAADTANGGLQQLETHYNTFIVSPFRLASLNPNHACRPSRISRRLLGLDSIGSVCLFLSGRLKNGTLSPFSRKCVGREYRASV